jgi:hypothetical protein
MMNRPIERRKAEMMRAKKGKSFFLVILSILFATACTPVANPAKLEPATVTPTVAATETAPSTPALNLELTPTSTPTPIPPTTTSSPSPKQAVPDRILNWQEQAAPEKLMRFAFDGEWLVALVGGEVVNDSPRYSLVARRQNGIQGAPYEQVFDFPERKTASKYESGSGLLVAGGQVAVVSAPSVGDSALGYEVYLIDLEGKTTKLLKKSKLAYPAIALSERWLVLLDSSSELIGGEWCLESYHLPDGPFQKITCTEGRIQWPVLVGDLLTYKYIEPGQECSVVKSQDLATGEEMTYQPETCQIGISIYSSKTITAWYEVSQTGGVSLGGIDSQEERFFLDIPSNNSMVQVCGRSIYHHQVANQGAVELRSYHPGRTDDVLFRYRLKDPNPQAATESHSQISTLPEYGWIDFACGNGRLAVYNGKTILIAIDDQQAGP